MTFHLLDLAQGLIDACEGRVESTLLLRRGQLHGVQQALKAYSLSESSRLPKSETFHRHFCFHFFKFFWETSGQLHLLFLEISKLHVCKHFFYDTRCQTEIIFFL